MITSAAECALCKGTEHTLIYTTRDRHYGIQGEFKIYRCENCSLVFIKPFLSEDELNSLYPETYYAYQDFAEEKPSFRKTIRNLLVKRATKDPVFEKPGKILDVGCGSGRFLYKMREQGWEVYGAEPSKAAAEVGNQANLNIFAGNLLDAKFESDAFDYVRSNHSFEHIINPNEVLDEMYRVLKPSGKLMIGVPNIGGLNAKIFKKYWYYLGAPVHPFNYSAKTLTQLLKKHGFKIEKVNYNSDFTGILGSMQIYFNRKDPKLVSADGAWINNDLMKMIFHRIAKILDVFRAGDAMEIICTK